MDFTALGSVFTILIMILVGIGLRYKQILTEESVDTLTGLVVKVSVPCLLFLNSYEQFNIEFLKNYGLKLFLPLLLLAISYSLGRLVAGLFKVNKKDRGLFAVMFGCSNSIFIGLPVNVAIFGDEAVPYVTAFFLCNTLVFWTIGIIGIAGDGGTKLKFKFSTLKHIFGPPVVGYILGITFGMLKGFMPDFLIPVLKYVIPLPEFLTSALKYIGGMTTPLSMLLTGTVIFSINREDFKLSREMGLVLLGRFIITPALFIALALTLSPGGGLMNKVFLLEAGMPVMSQALVMSRHYGANYKLAALMITVTTAVSMIAIPILAALTEVL